MESGDVLDAAGRDVPEQSAIPFAMWAIGLVSMVILLCIPVMLTPISSDCDPLALEVLAHLFQRW